MSFRTFFAFGFLMAIFFGGNAVLNTDSTTGLISAALAQDFKAKSVDDTDYGDAFIYGDPNAPVTIMEFASMTCPHCAAFHTEKWPEIKKKYIDTGMVKLVFKDFPFDQRAAGAAMLSRCVADGRRMAALDALFKTQATWARSEDYMGELAKIGKLAGLSRDKVEACLQNEEVLNAVLMDRQEGMQTYKVDSTPTFFINGEEKISGNIPLEDFEEVLDSYFE